MTSPIIFCLPIRTPISNDRIKLVPWETDLHGASLVSETQDPADLFAHMICGPFPTIQSVRQQFDLPDSPLAFHTSPEHLLLAVVDKTKPPSPEDEDGEVAGMVGYLFTSTENLCTEIGPVITFPRFQRSHVTSNAIGLLLQLALTSAEEGGLGLRRVDWQCNETNVASRKVAERLGFQKVGVLPWDRRYVNGAARGKVGNGKPLPPGSGPGDVWRDTALYTVGWDVWERESRAKVEKAMAN